MQNSLGKSTSKGLLPGSDATRQNALGSGGPAKLPASRGIKIESRRGILSRKSSVNKNSFYKQKAKVPAAPIYGGNPLSSGSGGMGLPNAIANRGASSYFNKGAMGNKPPSNGALPSLGSGGISQNNPTQKGQIGTYGNFNKNSAIGGSRAPPGLAAMGGYKYGGISGGIG